MRSSPWNASRPESSAPRVFITGASSGLGEALARAYARRFPSVVLGLFARRLDRLERLAKSLPHATCHCFSGDLLQSGLPDAASAFCESAGAPDIVIANAGISAGTVTGAGGDGTVFRRIVATNLTAMFDTFDAFLPALRARGSGTLVGVASMAGIRGLPGSGAYSASKAGAIAYLESLRVELAGTSISVVTLAPGFIRTPMTEKNPYPMPFLMDADRFADLAVESIARRRSWKVIPWQMGLVSGVLRVLPNPVYDRLFRNMGRKPRETQ